MSSSSWYPCLHGVLLEQNLGRKWWFPNPKRTSKKSKGNNSVQKHVSARSSRKENRMAYWSRKTFLQCRCKERRKTIPHSHFRAGNADAVDITRQEFNLQVYSQTVNGNSWKAEWMRRTQTEAALMFLICVAVLEKFMGCGALASSDAIIQTVASPAGIRC